MNMPPPIWHAESGIGNLVKAVTHSWGTATGQAHVRDQEMCILADCVLGEGGGCIELPVLQRQLD